MPITMRQVGPCFAAEVDGVDLTKPLSPDEVEAVHAGMDRYAVLVFHDQQITDEQQLAFTRSLGDIEHAIGTGLRGPDAERLPTTFADVSNLNKDNKVFARDDRPRLFGLGNRLWHSDSSFKVIPAKYSLLPRRQHPVEGRQYGVRRHARRRTMRSTTRPRPRSRSWSASTRSSSRAASSASPTSPRRSASASSRCTSASCARTRSRSAGRSTWLSHAGGILGWPVPEARAFLRDLVEHATQRQFVYAHTWRVNDLVMWDNRQTMHRARPFPAHEPRDMRRTTLMGDGPTGAHRPLSRPYL